MTASRGRQPRTLASRLPGPEIAAGLLVLIVTAVVGSGLAFGRTPTPPGQNGDPPRATASPGGPTVEPTTAPLVDPAVVNLLGIVNARLVAAGESLTSELTQKPVLVGEVARIIRQANANLQFAADQVPDLGGQTGEDQVGGRMAALYRSVQETATITLRASLNNADVYRLGAGVMADLLTDLPELQAELEALVDAPPTVAPTASASATPTAPPTSTPSTPPAATPTPAPTPTPPPTVAPPTAAPTPSLPPGEQVRDGGFEGGVVPPWEFRVAVGSAATIAADTNASGAGSVSARVDITVGSPAFAGISLRQPGLTLDAGARYQVSISVRAASAREIRLRIASPDGASYLTRTVPVTTAWTTATFTFTSPVTDPEASIEIDLGRSAVTTWIDSVSFMSGTPPVP